MRVARLAPPIVLAVVALAAVGCGGDEGSATSETSTAETVATDTTAETPARGLARLTGTVGSRDDPDAYEIELTTEDGAEITTTLPPGRYQLELNDLSTIHNFHLTARRTGVDVASDVAGTGAKTTVVVLQDGEAYIYACDAHWTRMHVTFSVHGRIRTQN